MAWQKDQVCSGFRVTHIQASEELHGRGIRMIHEKTGADLFWLDNGAENKVFSIGFTTLPQDDTGVFHILEHSVLCGSERFPVREPFVELLKSSMSTFLNAMTFPDMTLYPVSSRNDRDLLNLTEVYLDAVFAPFCAREEKIFRQEGWHIEPDEEGRMTYKGVVFNEMKGSMSDVDTVIEEQTVRQLFPDTSYGWNSGGDPEHIPDLSFEQFQEAYHRHYHPSNARIYLDGAVPMEDMLQLLDRYLSRYGKRTDLPVFTPQTPVASEAEIEYELGQEEDLENKGHLVLSRIVGLWRDRAENMARGIICDVLTGNNEAPLKRMILEQELAQDLTITLDDTGYQSWITIHAERIRDGAEREIREAIRTMGERIAREGLDRDAAEASLNRAIYYLREEAEPQGIGRCIRSMGTWLYGGDPMEALTAEPLVRSVRAMLEDGRMNALAADMLLNEEGLALLRARPSHTLGEERRAREEARVAAVTAGWSPAERKAQERMLSTLENWQQTPDSEESLRTLPMLTKADADVEPEWIGTETDRCLGVTRLQHRIACNGVVHLRAYFSLADLSLEQLKLAAGLTGLLGKLPTAQHDAASLQLEIKRDTGSLGFAIVPRSRRGETETCTPYLVAYASVLQEKADLAQRLLAEILTSTRFDQADRINEIMQQTELGVRQRIVSAGHAIGARETLSRYSAENAVRNVLEGDEMVRCLHALSRDPEGTMPAFRAAMEDALARGVCRKRMLISVTSDDEVDVTPLVAALPEGEAAPEAAAYRVDKPARAGYRIPAQIGYAVRGYHLGKCGLTFTGSMWVAASIISLGYLWNRVRVQGGAYGAGLSVDRSGNLFSYSYRDPTPGKTLAVDAGMSAFLREFAESGENLDKYIISSLNELNPLLSPREKGAQADQRYMTGLTRAEVERIRQEVLHTSREDLIACGTWLDAFARDGAICVVAHEGALESCDQLQVSDL